MSQKGSHMRKTLSAAALAASLLLSAAAAQAQQRFATPQEAASAFVDALISRDSPSMSRILGADWKRYVPTDGVDSDDVTDFLAAWSQGHRIESDGKLAHLQVGPDHWQLPIPLVMRAGQWQFDTRAGANEIQARRIGRNELDTIRSLLAVVDAQREYSAVDHNGDGIPEYARRFISTPGQQDGLYWPTPEGAPVSPLGPLFAEHLPGEGYHGYRYRLLQSQGPNARGGARDYRIKGRLTAGFGVVAWPVKYGETGVMSFIVNHDGVVYQKNLGPDSARKARAMESFDPDPSWTKVSP